MKKAPPPHNEVDRLAALKRYGIVDMPPDAVLDGITQAAADLCETPIALISLIDPSRQWFKACIGMPMRETSRDLSFCSHAILEPTELMEVEDASQDERFCDNPLVIGEPMIRFYAGCPLVNCDFFALGTLCVIDDKPRRLSAAQRHGLSSLAQVVMGLLEERQASQITAIDRVVEQAGRDGVMITDPSQPGNPITYANRAIEVMTGYSKAELIGKNCRLLQGQDTDVNTIAELREAIAALKPCTVVLKNYRKNGTVFWNELTVTPIIDSVGNTRNFVGVQHDVTDRVHHEELMNLRNRAIEAVDVGVSITDATKENHPLVYVNQTLCTLTGYTPDELLGRSVRILQKGNDYQTEHLWIEEAQAKGEPVHVVLESTRKDGSHFMDELSLSPVHNAAGELTNYIGINRDVTSKLHSEAQLHQAQKLDAIGQLSGGIAHDFNNLLSVIIGNLEFLATHVTDETERHFLNEADRAAKMGARLTHRLLTFANNSQLDPVVLNVNDAVLTTMELLDSIIGETITLSYNLSADLWSIRADPSEIENSVVNLALNARDAMPDGGTINVETKNVCFTADDGSEISPGNYVQLSVSDTGSGMTDEVRGRIFEPFFTTKEPGKGTGLGLASIHGFVHQSDGHIKVYSEVGRGTVINLFLPRYLEKNIAQASKAPAEIKPTHNDARILVVEDNDMVRELTVTRLRALGFNTEQASNGPEALQYIENNSDIDLILSDIVMSGGMSGYDVARWVQNNLPECKILLTSGFSGQMAEDNRLHTPTLQVLPKPYSLVELQHAINDILGT